MKKEMIHIVPFDMGHSFLEFDYNKKQNKESFLESMLSKLREKQIPIEIIPDKKYLIAIKVYENIRLFILEWGIGVFVVEKLSGPDILPVNEYFDDNIACELYSKKKTEQRMILNQIGELSVIKRVMDTVWECLENKRRVVSATEKYKHNGLSYVLSIYHIIKEQNDVLYDKEIDLLMNPGIISEIENNEQWPSIKRKISSYVEKGYSRQEYSDVSDVIASWSAVAVVEEYETNVISKIIDYEVSLQASWFLFDCLMDNIKQCKVSNLDLQKEKSIATYVSLEVSHILSANMRTNEKSVMESIYSTSGMDVLKDKLFLLLDNRIAIEEAKLSKNQSVYGIITEVLLVLFTLVSIYEPIKNIICGTIEPIDIGLGIVMVVVLVVYTILIIGKDK